MTIVAFEKEVSLKSLSIFSKTIVRQYCSLKLEKKHLISINGKEIGRRRKVQVTKAAFKGLHRLFSSRRRACLVLKHNRVSEVFKRAQICDRCSLEYFAMHGRFHSRGRTHHRAGSVTRIAFYCIYGFSNKLFQR